MTPAWTAWLAGFDVPLGATPWPIRLVVAGLAVVVAGRGAALERHGLRLAVALAGALAAVAWMHDGTQFPRIHDPFVWTGAMAIGAAGALWVEHLHFRLGLFVAGLVSGAVWGMATATAAHADDATAWVSALACTAALTLPWVFETVPRWLSPFLAAPALAWAAGWSDQLPALVAVWVMGLAAQWFTGPSNIVLDRPPPSLYRTPRT